MPKANGFSVLVWAPLFGGNDIAHPSFERDQYRQEHEELVRAAEPKEDETKEDETKFDFDPEVMMEDGELV